MTVSGTSSALESLEVIFGQDLNGDGVIGLYAAPGTTLQISTALGRSLLAPQQLAPAQRLNSLPPISLR